MEKLQMRNKGITLVALVITIIILLILAGISIATLTGSGLFENARLAEQKSKNAQELEDSTLKDYENKIGEYIDSSRETINISKEEYEGLKKKGTWELLASTTAQTETQYTVEDLNKYSSFILMCYNFNGSLVASTDVTYEVFKNLAEKAIYACYNAGTAYVSVARYIDDSTIALRSANDKTGKTEFYGVY